MDNASVEELLQKGRWADAEHLCRSMLQVQPCNAKMQGYLGVCLFRQNRFEDAARAFKTASCLDPNFVDAGVKHAQSLFRLHRYEEAYEVAQHWLKQRPSDHALQGLIEQLEFQVKGNRTDGWERTRRLEGQAKLAEDL